MTRFEIFLLMTSVTVFAWGIAIIIHTTWKEWR